MNKAPDAPLASNSQLAVPEEIPKLKNVTKSQWITVSVLCFVNVLNYMDRFVVAGVMTDLKEDFKITNREAGLIQTVFILGYMSFAPVYGYLGDRYNRRVLMAFSVLLWGLTTFSGSLMRRFDSFVALRALVGIGEAGYSTVAPTIISDLFVKDVRGKILAMFYFAIPVGSGLGYILAAQTTKLTGSWHWALRVTPFFGVVSLFLILILVKEPERGESEGRTLLTTSSWGEDILALVKNRTYIFITLGFGCVTFVSGGLSWWGPDYIFSGALLNEGYENVHLHDISNVFGIITMLTGLLGVPLGQILACRLRQSHSYSDPLICAMGLFICMPLLFTASLCARISLFWCYSLIFLGELFLNLNWSIVADILLYVVIPTRRSTAEALQILISHGLGDAGSPYFLGALADYTREKLKEKETRPLNETVVKIELDYYSLQYSLFTTSFIEVLGGIFFLVATFYIIKDKLRAEKEIDDGGENPDCHFADEIVDSNGLDSM